jgi:hypothetical protein
MRTDDHRNPTAFTTDVAKTAGLVEGVDYSQGAPFSVPGPHGPVTYYTAKLLLNPIETTLRVIDTATFYVRSGGQRWIYIGIPAFIWNGLTRDQKVAVIGFMYQHEGGTAMRSLFPTLSV